LRNAYVIRCDEIIKNNQGEVVELHCSYDEKTLNVNPEGRKVQGVIHWVSARHAIAAEVHMYDRLFTHPTPDDGKEGSHYLQRLNPDSLRMLTNCYVEASLAGAKSGERFQFEREGYFCRDINDAAGKPVFNLTVGLRDSWARIEKT
jgi:glutaminyl-tRNA synthetase